MKLSEWMKETFGEKFLKEAKEEYKKAQKEGQEWAKKRRSERKER